jgi:tetratricopeptide (TPR) repeat protein
MRASVLPDARLVKHARRFVWLSVDTENPRNAAFLERFPIETWPTFLVIDQRDGAPILRWLGTATVQQLEGVLDDATARKRSAAAEALARADRANAAGALDDALAGYRDALAAGGPAWSRRDRAVVSLVLTAQAAGREEACAAAARAEAPRLPRGPAFAQVVGVGLACAVSAPRDAAWRPGAVAALEPLATEALELRGVLADDRAGLYEALVAAHADRGDTRGARQLAERWWAFLEAERRSAPTAEARAALDAYRVGAALALEDPARALPRLAESERALPLDYNPPARRALLLRELGRLEEARAAADRALARAYGPRKLRVYDLAASILEAQRDRQALARLADEALAFAETLPPGQASPKVVASLRARQQKAASASP